MRQMLAERTSRPGTGDSMLSDTTSLMTSTLRDMWEPFCSAGRSTKMSKEQLSEPFSLLPSPSLLTITGLRTLRTPTRSSLYLASPSPYCRSHFKVMEVLNNGSVLKGCQVLL